MRESYKFLHGNCAIKRHSKRRIIFPSGKLSIADVHFEQQQTKRVITFTTSTDKNIVYMFSFYGLLWLL